MPLLSFSYDPEVTITCGMDGLINSTIPTITGRASSSIDNSVKRYVDALVQFRFDTTTGVLATYPVIYVYAYGTSFGGSGDYTDNVTGTDGPFSFPNPSNLKLLASVGYGVAANTQVFAGPYSVAMAFGGVMPQQWGIVVNNQTGLSLAGTAGQQASNTASYVGVFLQTI